MKFLSIIFFNCLFCLVFCVGATAQVSAWLGNYQYNENGGKTTGGTAILIQHYLTIKKEGAETTAHISSQGYQTSRDLNCTVKAVGSKLMIYFKSYGENNRFEPYEPGDLLFTLERRKTGGKVIILTYWKQFEPAALRKWRDGTVHFMRSRN